MLGFKQNIMPFFTVFILKYETKFGLARKPIWIISYCYCQNDFPWSVSFRIGEWMWSREIVEFLMLKSTDFCIELGELLLLLLLSFLYF